MHGRMEVKGDRGLGGGRRPLLRGDSTDDTSLLIPGDEAEPHVSEGRD